MATAATARECRDDTASESRPPSMPATMGWPPADRLLDLYT
ncbi:hypothetical protein [Actinoplanes nipponensis]|nr:hypothetical protein [Actinoplanes nipponensis]